MINQFSIITLTFNEELHLPRLLDSVIGLNAPIFILDSGSSDKTSLIAQEYGATLAVHPFENHPKQWHYALNHFIIETDWVICLDADHIVSPVLFEKLRSFQNSTISQSINSIFFNRHNFFKGKRLKYGGYGNKFMLKMFRFGIGYSDLNENMDHRFIVPGDFIIWKDGILKEENLKENEIGFWINKHNRYSDLVAQEEVERIKMVRDQSVKPKIFGNPDQRMAYFKSIWWKMPLFFRPLIYFFYRFIIQLGILESREGKVFHFLQGFWFRLIVDIKIHELLNEKKNNV